MIVLQFGKNWQELARPSFEYFIDLSRSESLALRSLLSDLLLCHSVSEVFSLIFRMYTAQTSLYKNVNQFLRSFPHSIVEKFMNELR
jgi:hypothetical protein